MKQGEQVWLQRSKRRYLVEVVSDHTPMFPAVTIKRNGEEWIVGIGELVTYDQIQQEQKQKQMQEEQSVQDIVEAYKLGHRTFGAIARALNTQQVKILSRCRKAERMGLIKLERRNRHASNIIVIPTETSPSNPGTPMPNL